MNPSNTVFDVKRLIGRNYEDPKVQSNMKYWPFVVLNEGGKPKIKVEYKNEVQTFFPEEICSMVLVKMKETAETYLGKVQTLLRIRGLEGVILHLLTIKMSIV